MAARRRRAVASAALPMPFRLAARLPVPGNLVVRIGGAADPALVAAAGLDGVITAGDVRRARSALTVAGGGLVACSLLVPVLLPVSLAATVWGWVWPGMALAGRARRRRREIATQLPDVLDLLGVCVEAGMALDPAMRTVSVRLGGALGDELARVLGDLAVGSTRRDAYRAMAVRTGLPDVDAAVGALLTADELGTPLSGVLRDQAGSLRASAGQAARDRAARAAPKTQLVVAMMMVPAIMLLVVTVMGLELIRQMGPVMGGLR
ncbi:MAG: type II secretion system F family protein [Thermoleophilia bacterium]